MEITEFTWKKLHFTQTATDPVVVVSWNDAVAFCDWLSKKEGRVHWYSAMDLTMSEQYARLFELQAAGYR